MASCYVWDCIEPTIMPQSVVSRTSGSGRRAQDSGVISALADERFQSLYAK